MSNNPFSKVRRQSWSSQGRDGLPNSLCNTESLRGPFDHARDPFISAQLKSLSQDETKRREGGDGSRMVKLHKPFPELRPKHDRTQIRKSFNWQISSEHRRAKMAQFQAQEQYLTEEKTQSHDIHIPKSGLER